MRKIFLAIIIFICFISACNTTGVPTEFANACAQDLDGKTLEVTGILQPRTSIFCSNRGGRMECPFEFVETAGSEKKMTADIEVGSGANTVDEIPKGFKKEDLKVRDNAGNPVALSSDKVKLTGKMMIAPAAPGGQGVCLMQVYKIEK
jgi:hypothetical protein